MISLQNDVAVEAYGITSSSVADHMQSAYSRVRGETGQAVCSKAARQSKGLLVSFCVQKGSSSLLTSLLTARLLQYQAIAGNPK